VVDLAGSERASDREEHGQEVSLVVVKADAFFARADPFSRLVYSLEFRD